MSAADVVVGPVCGAQHPTLNLRCGRSPDHSGSHRGWDWWDNDGVLPATLATPTWETPS